MQGRSEETTLTFLMISKIKMIKFNWLEPIKIVERSLLKDYRKSFVQKALALPGGF